MLAAIEKQFLDGIKSASKAGIPTTNIKWGTGPGAVPAKSDIQYISILATGLTWQPVANTDALSRVRAPAMRYASLTTNGTANLQLPTDSVDPSKVVEIELAGRTTRQGDDYFLEDRNAKFYQTPANGTKAMVAMRDAGLRGYVERRPCEATLLLGAWLTTSKTLAEADTLGSQLLAGALTVTVDMPNLEAAMPADSSTRQRLVAPWAVLSKVDRTRETLSTSSAGKTENFDFWRVLFTFTLRGDIELAVATTALSASKSIEAIQGVVTRTGINGESLQDSTRKDSFNKLKK